jgi:hypothetical protein
MILQPPIVAPTLCESNRIAVKLEKLRNFSWSRGFDELIVVPGG